MTIQIPPLAIRLHVSAGLNERLKMTEAKTGDSIETMVLRALALFVELEREDVNVLLSVAEELRRRRGRGLEERS